MLSMWLEICFGLLVAGFLGYRFLIGNYGYWKSLGYPHLAGRFPYGTDKELSTNGRYLGFVFDDVYKKLDPHPYGGIYIMRRPALLLRDPDVIKHILVKDFHHFRDRSRILSSETDPLSQHLFGLNGDKWRALRVKMTPTFTSGKLKNMYALFVKCSSQLDEVLGRLAEDGEAFDVKDLMASFTSDVIGSCAFGIDVNSLKNSDNDFRRMGAEVFPNFVRRKEFFRTVLHHFIPGFNKFFDFNNRFSERTVDFMYAMVRDNVEYREKNGVKRNDFLDLLIDMKHDDAKHRTGMKKFEETNVEMTMDLLVAQCFIFILAGLETSSSVTTFCLYELALNPEIQEKLRREIRETTKKHGGLTYEAIKEMTYLDQVVSETLRKYPTLQFLTRFCTKPYRMPGGESLDEGTQVFIPTYSLHHDPKYFPEPEKFNPDRFSPERKSSIPQFAYLPFGEGPRICIGMRFGLLQTKMGICTFLPKYNILTTPETPIPLKMARTGLITQVKEPIKVQIKELH